MEYITYLAWFFFALIGLCVGSYLNVVIYRTPLGMSTAKPASHCPGCKSAIKWYDNIPILSYIILGGKCRNCKCHISLRYTLVELANMLLWLLSAVLFWNINPYYAGICAVVLSCLVCVFFIDIEHQIILDRFNIIIAVCGIAAVFVNQDISWLEHIIGMVVGGGFFLLIYYCSLAILKKEGLGGGDIKLMAASGLLLGWKSTLLAMLVASVIGSVVLLILTKKTGDEQSKQYPFAPFLSFGIALALLLGPQIIEWYMSLLTGGWINAKI